VELAARYSELTFDDDVFSLSLSDAGVNASKARAWAVGANWYLNQHVRLQVNFEQTRFRYESSDAGRPAENVILVRTQLST
jgi:phosphate-selective porin OprO and OprP